ncbi:MAG: hypothetical protein WC000_03240 [Dokdonella sp.]|jgi:hypothetical protein|nr:MAG: hypothetical protein BGP25_03095 [Xanthomonadales bacterium 63-13]
MLILLFILWTAFCIWAIFMRGAEFLDGYIISGQTGKPFTPGKLRLYIGITWLLGLGLVLLNVFYGPKG